MRISDWSSDVCSSDLLEQRFQGEAEALAYRGDVAALSCQAALQPVVYRQQFVQQFLVGKPPGLFQIPMQAPALVLDLRLLAQHRLQLGRASCRERVCQYV